MGSIWPSHTKPLDSALAIAFGIVFAVGMAGLPDEDRWSSARIIPSVMFGGALSFSLIKERHSVIGDSAGGESLRGIVVLAALAIPLVALICISTTTTAFLAAVVWSALLFAIRMGLCTLRGQERRLRQCQPLDQG